MSLTSLVLQRGVATMRQVEEALARQVIYGGDLVTNLLEVATMDEAALTSLLAETLELAPAPLGLLPSPSDAVKAMLPVEVATEHSILPLSADGDRLVVAVAEKLGADVEDKLGFALGVTLEQRVAPLVRIRQGLARAYAIPLERRMQRLVARLGDASASGSSAVVSTGAGVGGSMPPILTHAPETAQLPRFATRPPVRASSSAKPAADATASAASPAPAIPAATHDARNTPDAPDGSARSSGPKLLQRDAAVTALPARRRRGPLTIETATRELDEAGDRDGLLGTFFDFARQFFDYSALFVVHGDIAEGRDAFGNGVSRDRVVGIGVPMDFPGLLATARNDAVSVVGRPLPDSVDAVLLQDLKRPPGAEILVAPVVVRKRSVAFLVADCEDAGFETASVELVKTFAVTVGHAFERLILRKKGQMVPASRAEPRAPRRVTKEFPAFVVPPEPNAPVAPMAPITAETPSPSEHASSGSARGHASLPPDTSRDSSPPRHDGAHDIAADDSYGATPSASRVSPAAVTGSFAPPPPNTVAVRRPTGRPIPREEPPPDDLTPPIPRLAPFPAMPDHARDQVPAASAGAAQAAHDGARAEDSSDPYESGTLKAMPINETPVDAGPDSAAIAIPPHKPPARSRNSDRLPSVIVDMNEEFGALVERFLSPGGDEQAESELLRQGERALPTIMARFPGAVDRARAEETRRASECGPILRLVAGQRRVALPFVLAKVADADPEIRYWATFVLGELPYIETVPALVPQLLHDDPKLRRVARIAAASIAKAVGDPLVAELTQAFSRETDERKRTFVIEALGEIREAGSVPSLAAALSDSSDMVADAAYRALMVVTRQDFGRDAKRWSVFWSANATRHRIEWLTDALDHEESAIRTAAGEELRTITKEYFGYSPDLPPKDRERAQQRYRDWWVTEGRARFRKR